jgi:hypothetical protein
MSGHIPVLLAIGTSICMLLVGSVILFSKEKTVSSFMQLLGAACLTVVLLSHTAETFDFLPWMQWGVEQSAGHYLDLGSAALGLTLFPFGYLWQAISKRAV